MRRLVCASVVRKPPKTGFLALWPNYTLYENRNANSVTQTHLPVKVLDVKKLTNIMSLISWLCIDLDTGLRLVVFARG